MTRFEKAVRKYLADRAEPEALLARSLDGAWGRVIVIPARRETAAFLPGIEAAAAEAAPERVLVLVVVNGEAGDERTAIVNRRLIADARATCDGTRDLGGGEGFLGSTGPFDVLFVERSGPGRELPSRRGVGLARKIGADLALALRVGGRVGSPWIHNSDADAIQPGDRFAVDRADPGSDVVAWTHPFVHEPVGEPDLDESGRLYDLSLRWYADGLRGAGSPWGYLPIGSTLTIRAEAYAAVRGFPRREAAEDFHLLAKLAKVGSVAEAATGPVRLRVRVSDRVPFGTGASMTPIRDALRRGEPFRLYHPAGFRLLGRWEEALRRDDPFDGALEAGLSPGESAALRAALEAIGAKAALARLPRSGRRVWFDALRTLRFVHEVRDAGFPKLPLAEAIALGEALGRASQPGGARSGSGRPSAQPAPKSPAQTAASPAVAPGPRPESGK